MAIRSMIKTTALLPLLLVLCMLCGCLRNPSSGQRGSIMIRASIPNEFMARGTTSASSFSSRVSTLIFTVSRGSALLTRSVRVEGNVAEVKFVDLAVGTWQVHVVGESEDGLTVCVADSPAEIRAGEVTPVELEMVLVAGSLNVTVEFCSVLGIVSGTVTLVNPVGDSIEGELEINGSSGSALFSDVAAMTWPIKVRLYDLRGDLVLEGETQATVRPNDTTSALIKFPNGSISIGITLRLPPSAPTGLRVERDTGRVLLSWDANSPSEQVVGYLVYRSDGELAPLTLVSDRLVDLTNHEDPDIVDKQAYWYSVQAFNGHGLAGELSQRVSVEAHI